MFYMRMNHIEAEKKKRFDRVYEEYSNLLYRVGYGILKDFQLAQDVVQDTYLAYLDKSAFKDDVHERAWLIRVTINKSRNLLKRSKRNVPLESLAERGVSVEDEGVIKEVLSLPEKYRLPIQLHYLEGYSVEEISSMLHIGVSATKMRLSRGRDMLKIKLEEDS